MIPAALVPNSKIMLVGEFASESDIVSNTPYGRQVELGKMLGEAGLSRSRVSLSLVVLGRVAGGNVAGCMALTKSKITPAHQLFQGRWVTQDVIEGVAQLVADIARVNPNVVVAMGNLALWALTGEWGVTNWRSSVMESILIPGLKVIPTLSPSIVHKQWSQRPLIVHDFKRVARESATSAISPPSYRFVIRPSFEQAECQLLALISQAEKELARGNRWKLGVDIETRAGHIACIAFAWTKLDAVCIPLMCQHSAEGYWREEEEAALVRQMCKLLSLVTVVGQNWNYDAQYIYRWWHFLCPSVIDTMVQQHTCFSNLPKNLAFLSSMYLDDHLYWKDDRTNWTTGPKGEGEDKYWAYNCTDAVRTLAIHEVLSVVVEKMGMGELNKFQQTLTNPVVLNSMLQGVRVDMKARQAFSEELQAEILVREEWILQVLEHDLNIRSPKQMADFFYRQMGMKEIKHRTATGYAITCNDEALRVIMAREPILIPLIKRIMELRSLGVFHSTFIQAPLDTDGRIRTSFNTCGTETYRFSSSKNAFGTGLNCQNIPKGGEVEDDGLNLPNVRKIFIPDPGHTMFDIDLDSADLRIVTWESGCEWMKDHFRAGRKPYVEVMKEYYHNPTMTKNSHPREYAMFKSLCHGTNYLGTADGIAPRIGLNVLETERIQKWYFGMCPEIAKWQTDLKKQVAGRRYVQNVFGYRNYFFDKIEGTIFNQAVAWIPQSTVACLINRAYVNIHNNLKEVEVLLQVHDSLAGQFDSIHGDWALRRIKEEAEVPLPYSEPLIIPVGIVSSAKSWGDCG